MRLELLWVSPLGAGSSRNAICAAESKSVRSLGISNLELIRAPQIDIF